MAVVVFRNYQPKSTQSFRRTRWKDAEVAESPRGEEARKALAEQPAMSERRLRDLQVGLRN